MTSTTRYPSVTLARFVRQIERQAFSFGKQIKCRFCEPWWRANAFQTRDFRKTLFIYAGFGRGDAAQQRKNIPMQIAPHPETGEFVDSTTGNDYLRFSYDSSLFTIQPGDSGGMIVYIGSDKKAHLIGVLTNGNSHYVFAGLLKNRRERLSSAIQVFRNRYR